MNSSVLRLYAGEGWFVRGRFVTLHSVPGVRYGSGRTLVAMRTPVTVTTRQGPYTWQWLFRVVFLGFPFQCAVVISRPVPWNPLGERSETLPVRMQEKFLGVAKGIQWEHECEFYHPKVWMPRVLLSVADKESAERYERIWRGQVQEREAKTEWRTIEQERAIAVALGEFAEGEESRDE